jgi:hypothetical protein
MKFNYVEPKIDITKVNDIGRGVLFRPANSLDLYVKTDMTGDDNIFCECESRLLDFYENYTDNDYECANDLVACVCIEDGTLRFLHRDCRVIIVNYELNIEGAE